MFTQFRITCFSFLLLMCAAHAWSAETHLVAGAGPSTKIVTKFFDLYKHQQASNGHTYTVMPNSVKHKGGILHSDKFLFGRTGRPLNAKERSMGKSDIFLAKVPIAFVKGLEVPVSKLTMAQIEAIFTREITNWKEVGGDDAPIVLVGREPTEALFLELKADHDFFTDISFDKKFKRDDAVVKFLKSFDGRHAIAFGAKSNFTKYNLLEVDDFDSGAKLGLVIDNKNLNDPLVKGAIAFAKTDQWKTAVRSAGMLPVH